MQEKLRTSLTLISERLIALLRTSRRAAAAAVNQARVRSGLLQRGKVRTALIVTMILLVLLGIIVAPLRVIAGASQDYTQLKALGESGLHHLLAAKAALAPLAGTSTALQAFQTQADPSPVMPYTLAGAASVRHGVYDECDHPPFALPHESGHWHRARSRQSLIRTPSSSHWGQSQ